MKFKLNRIFTLLLAFIMLLSIVACARDQGTVEQVEAPVEAPAMEELQTIDPPVAEIEPELPLENTIPISTLVSNLRDQFGENETIDYQGRLWNVPRNHTFYIYLEFDVREDTDFEGIREVFAVYANAELTQPVGMAFEVVTSETDPTVQEGHNRLYIRPFRHPPGRVMGTFFDIGTRQNIVLDESGELFLHETEEGESWGFLRHFYLALHVDTQTAETLDRPKVTSFTIENSLDAPHSEFFVTEDGYGGFRWKEVEGADYYLIVRARDETNIQLTMEPIAKVTGTQWIHPENYWDPQINMNFAFRGIGASEDVMASPYWDGEAREITFNNFTVIAVNSETRSAMGNIHRGEDIAARLPRSLAWNALRQEEVEMDRHRRFIPHINFLPTHRPITMANGVTVQRRVVYDFDLAEVREDRHLYFSEDGNTIIDSGEYRINLHIPYRIEGTVFTGHMIVVAIDPDTYREQLDAVREQMEEAELRGGGAITVEFTERLPHDDEDTPYTEYPSDEILEPAGDRIFANSALSAFLAYNMLAGNEKIDLTDFPESANFDHLTDAFFEAIYQNPLILHVSGAGSIPGTNILVVQYKEPVDVIHRQQNAIREIVPEIIAEIITDDMTDLEKSIAINQFLVDTTEYDWGALENAEQFDFQSVDPEFNDSFTAYGILINRVGVCAGYAAAFRLLADEAGLESIVVTGYLEGFLPHAWNRVYIDGQWYTIDVTNNANEFLFNVFMHLPDDVAGTVLIEDGAFMQNDFLGYHRADGTTNEYFYVTDRFFGRDDIASELVDLIQQTGQATLRTDFDLDDDMFFKIAMEVMGLLDTSEIYGFHWLGVIYMTDGR